MRARAPPGEPLAPSRDDIRTIVASILACERAGDAAKLRARWLSSDGKSLRRVRSWPMSPFPNEDEVADALWAESIDVPDGSVLRVALLDGSGGPLPGTDSSWRKPVTFEHPEPRIIEVNVKPSEPPKTFEPPTVSVPESPVSSVPLVLELRHYHELVGATLGQDRDLIRSLMDQNNRLVAHLIQVSNANRTVVETAVRVLSEQSKTTFEYANQTREKADARIDAAHAMFTKGALTELSAKLATDGEESNDDSLIGLVRETKTILPDILSVLKGGPSSNALRALLMGVSAGDADTIGMVKTALSGLTEDQKAALLGHLVAASN